MEEYIKYFETHEEYEGYKESEEMLRPNVSYCEDVKDVHYNPLTWADVYFTTVALENGAITFTPLGSNMISYSIDGGNIWTEENNVTVESGDKVLWKGTMTPSSNGIGNFSSTCNFDVQGNIMSLIYGDNFKNQLSLDGKNSCFTYLFNGSNVVSAKDLVLPATTLAAACYSSMFQSCTSLTTAPELPATTLAAACYGGMFQGCTSLTTAPELSATTLVSSCYGIMFQGCTSLNYIMAMFTTTPSDSYTSYWVDSVAASGTFVKNSAATWNVSGVNGIPEGWIVETVTV